MNVKAIHRNVDCGVDHWPSVYWGLGIRELVLGIGDWWQSSP